MKPLLSKETPTRRATFRRPPRASNRRRRRRSWRARTGRPYSSRNSRRKSSPRVTRRVRPAKIPRQIRANHQKTQDSHRPPELIKSRALASLSCPAQVKWRVAMGRQLEPKRARSRAVRPTSWTYSSRRSTRTRRSDEARSRPKNRRKTWRPRCKRRWTRVRREAAEWRKRKTMATIAAREAVTEGPMLQQGGMGQARFQ